MKKTTLIILTLLVNLSFGQGEKETYKIIAQQFEQHYNNEDYNSIFSLFSETMQKALPIDKTTDFLINLKSQAGKITQREFIKYENGTYASYKTNFEHALFVLNISIDEQSKINGLFIKPFVEEKESEKAINNLSIDGASITKEQSKLIFDHSKTFPNQTQISFAILNNGKVNYYGIKKEDQTIEQIVNHQSVFEIGSISKVFTATLLAQFVTDGTIKLDDTLDDYLKTSFHNNAEITFLSLANHTSGLPRLPSNLDLTMVNPDNPYESYDEQELNSYLKENVELFNKGTYEYSNLGAGLLGYTLSNWKKTTYENLLQDYIFSKYAMNNSTTDDIKIKGVFVKGLNSDGKEVPNWNLSVLAGAGAILSTTEDLSKFALAQFDRSNKELKLTRKKTAEVHKNMRIGLGWHIIKTDTESIWYWHNGGTGGYTSSIIIDPLTKNGIIILSNVSAFHPNMGNIDTLGFELMKSLEKNK